MELYNCVCNAMNEDGISKVKKLLEENKDKILWAVFSDTFCPP